MAFAYLLVACLAAAVAVFALQNGTPATALAGPGAGAPARGAGQGARSRGGQRDKTSVTPPLAAP
jgi:hypothetical protein